MTLPDYSKPAYVPLRETEPCDAIRFPSLDGGRKNDSRSRPIRLNSVPAGKAVCLKLLHADAQGWTFTRKRDKQGKQRTDAYSIELAALDPLHFAVKLDDPDTTSLPRRRPYKQVEDRTVEVVFSYVGDDCAKMSGEL